MDEVVVGTGEVVVGASKIDDVVCRAVVVVGTGVVDDDGANGWLFAVGYGIADVTSGILAGVEASEVSKSPVPLVTPPSELVWVVSYAVVASAVATPKSAGVASVKAVS